MLIVDDGFAEHERKGQVCRYAVMRQICKQYFIARLPFMIGFDVKRMSALSSSC